MAYPYFGPGRPTLWRPAPGLPGYEGRINENGHLEIRPVKAPAEPVRAEQHTECAVCRQDKPTPLRRDDMGGYVCLTCIDKQLTALSMRVKQLETAGPQQMRKGWYVHCLGCGATVFVARWKWSARQIMGTYIRRMNAGLINDCCGAAENCDCRGPLELQWKEKS